MLRRPAMKKIGKYILGCFISILIMSAFWIHPVYADNTVAQLTLHAYGKSTITGSSAGGDVGHTFLSIKNKTNSTLNFLDYPIPAKEMITVSIWQEGITSIGSGGIYINLEMILSKNVDNASISIDITQQQLDLIAKNSPKESYYKQDLSHAIWHNCTTYSTKMWNLVSPKQYKVTDGILGADAPKWVAEKINKMSGHQNGPFIVKRNIDSGDIFYVTKNKELVPAGFKVPNLYNSKVSKNSVSLNWSSSKKWLLNGQTNITGYEVKYSLSDGSQTKTKTFSSEGGTISGLKYGKRYKCQVRALYKKGNYNLCSKYSNTVSFTTSKAPKASIKLNKSKISMYITESTKVKATASGKSKKVTWKSSNSKIATVKNGVITAKKTGTVTITASCNGEKKTCRVTVKGDWYQKVLRSSASYKIKGAFDKKTYTISRNDFYEYRLFDINKDGIKELMLYKRPAAAVFTFYKGKVVPLAYSSFTRSICLKGKYFTMMHGTSSENTCYVFTLKNGKFHKVGEYFHTTSSAYPVPIYKINGKNCSKTTFFKTYDKYMKNATYL